MLSEPWHIDVVATTARGNGVRMTDLTVEAVIWVTHTRQFVSVPAAGNRSDLELDDLEGMDEAVIQ